MMNPFPLTMPPQPPCFHTLQNQATTKSSQNIQPRLQTSKKLPESTFISHPLAIHQQQTPRFPWTTAVADDLFVSCLYHLQRGPTTHECVAGWEAETFATGPAHLVKGRNQMSGVMDFWKFMNTAGLYPSQSLNFLGWEEVSFCRVFLNRWPSFVKLA